MCLDVNFKSKTKTDFKLTEKGGLLLVSVSECYTSDTIHSVLYCIAQACKLASDQLIRILLLQHHSYTAPQLLHCTTLHCIVLYCNIKTYCVMWFIYGRMSVRTAVTYNALYSIRTRTDPAPRTHILAYSNRAD